MRVAPSMVAFTPIWTWLPILGWRSQESFPLPPSVTCCMMVTWSPTLAASPTTMPAGYASCQRPAIRQALNALLRVEQPMT